MSEETKWYGQHHPGCGGMDMEMKNAVAIQRNAAAIAAVIKSFQLIEHDVEELKKSIAEPDLVIHLQERLDAVEEEVRVLNESISGQGGIQAVLSEIQDTISSLSASVNGVSEGLNNTNAALIATQTNVAGLVGRVEEIEDVLSGWEELSEKVDSNREDLDKVMDSVYKGETISVITSDGASVRMLVAPTDPRPDESEASN